MYRVTRITIHTDSSVSIERESINFIEGAHKLVSDHREDLSTILCSDWRLLITGHGQKYLDESKSTPGFTPEPNGVDAWPSQGDKERLDNRS